MSFSPIKPRTYDTPKHAVAALVADAGGVPKVMEILKLSRTRVYALADPDDDASLSFERVATLTRVSKSPAAAQYLAALAGGVFMPAPEGEGDEADWHAKAARASVLNAGTVSSLIAALSEDSDAASSISPDEARDILAQLDQQMAALAQARSQLAALTETS